MSRTKYSAPRGQGRCVLLRPRPHYKLKIEKVKKAIAKKAARARKAIADRITSTSTAIPTLTLTRDSVEDQIMEDPIADSTLTLTTNPKVSSSEPAAADEMDLWCPVGDPDEDCEIIRLIPFGSPRFNIPVAWQRARPYLDHKDRLPVIIVRNRCSMREWQFAQRRLLKSVHDFGQQPEFEKLDYIMLCDGRLGIKFPDPIPDNPAPAYPNVHFQTHWLPDFCSAITDEEIALAFTEVWPAGMF